MNLLLSWLILAVAVWGSAYLLPGVKVHDFKDALVVAAIFGILNWCIGWFLFGLIGITTLGLGFLLAFVTRWIVDAIVLRITGALTPRITIAGFGSALLCAMFMSAIGTFAQYVLMGHSAHHV